MPLIAAGIGAAGSAIGGIMGGKGAKKAAKTAAKAQMAIADKNNALIQWNYGQNAARLDPFVAGGTRAGNVLMELLLGPAPKSATPAPIGGGSGGIGGSPAGGPSPLSSSWQGLQSLLGNHIDGDFDRAALAFIQANQDKLPPGYTLASVMADPTNTKMLQQVGGAIASTPAPIPVATSQPQGATSNATGKPVSALGAWDQFRNSTNYDWRFKQGQEATAQNFAGTSLDSGAQRIAELEYGQQFASNELGNWMNMLAGQQGIGLQAGSALAGVGTAGVNGMMANNQNAADAQSNQALINGQASQNMWGTIGQGIGQVAGAWGSSYNTPGSAPSPIVTSYQNPAYGGGSAWSY